jgi:hypothetical protein
VQGGWKSRQTVQQEEGLDPQREQQNIEDYNRRMGTGDKSDPVPVHEANFNPNEPRDERGRWTKSGGGARGASSVGDSWQDLLSKDQLRQWAGSPGQVTVYAAGYGENDSTPGQAAAEAGAGAVEPMPPGKRDLYFRMTTVAPSGTCPAQSVASRPYSGFSWPYSYRRGSIPGRCDSSH